MKNGLYTGRFQPFHLGHLSAIRQALKQVDKLYIAIGSSQYDHQPQNPLTSEERKVMIHSALRSEGLESRCEVFLVPDIHNDEKWTGHVRSIVPDFQEVFAGNTGIVKELFEKYDNAQVHLVDHELNISATKIRKAIVKGEPWKEFVLNETAQQLEALGFKSRLKT